MKTAANCDFNGNDIANIGTTSADLCGASCVDPNCYYFTYNPATTTCWLKKPFPAASNVIAAISTGASCGYVNTRLISG